MVFGKIPPQAIEIERAVLGAILIERDAFDVISGILTAEKFYLLKHQHVFRAIADLQARNLPVDVMTVYHQLAKNGTLEEVGGAYELTKMTDSVVSSANVLRWGRVIFEKHLQREMIRVAGEILQTAYEETEDVFEMLERAEQKVLEIGNQNIQNEMATSADVAFKAIQQITIWKTDDRYITGVPSGLKAIDKATRGWQAKDLIILAARPSVGKTALALMLAKAATTNDINPVDVALFSLEMENMSLMLRMISEESGVMLYKIQTGKLSDDEFKKVNDSASKLGDRNIYFDDSNGLTILTLRSKVRRLKKKRPKLGLIIIDYLQLMSGEGRGNREQEISGISRGLKQVAREEKIAIIALSQLSRDLEKGGKPREPQISDLRESGAIEQDADVVLLAWAAAEDAIKQDASLTNRRYIRIAKARNGFLWRQELEFDTTIQRIAEYEAAQAEPKKQQGGTWKPIDLPI